MHFKTGFHMVATHKSAKHKYGSGDHGDHGDPGKTGDPGDPGDHGYSGTNPGQKTGTLVWRPPSQAM